MLQVKNANQIDSTLPERGVDLTAQYAIGINNAIKGLTDLMGAENPASQFFGENAEWYRGLLSATALKNEAEISRILTEAEDRGILDQLAAGARAFGTAPADMVAGGLGSLTTFAVGGAAARAAGLGVRGIAAAQAGLGSGMQAGIVKNEIYQGVREEMSNLGKSEYDSERIAREAQSYSGKNLDQILIGAGLGGVDGLTGAQRIIGRALLRGGLNHGASRVASVLGNGLAESGVEAAQGGQEKLSTNIGVSREGVKTSPMRGVVGAATLEGIVGGVIGGGLASVQSRSPSPSLNEQPAKPQSVSPVSSAPPSLSPGEVKNLVSSALSANSELGKGRNAVVLNTASPDFVLRVEKSSTRSPDANLASVEDRFPGMNLGQAIASGDGMQLLRRQSGVPAGLDPLAKKDRSTPEGQASNDANYAASLKRAAAMPQSAYNAFAETLAKLSSVGGRGAQFDPSKSNNVLIDERSGQFNLVDINENSSGYASDVNDMVSVLMDNGNSHAYKGEDLAAVRKEIFTKSLAAAQGAGLSTTLNSSGKFSAQLAGISLTDQDLSPPAQPSPPVAPSLAPSEAAQKVAAAAPHLGPISPATQTQENPAQRSNTPSVPPAEKARNEKGGKSVVSPEKAKILGVQNDPIGSYIASNYPEVAGKAKNPEEFSANVKSWRHKIEQSIGDGKHLNQKVATSGFLRQYGYEPSPSQYAEMLGDHRRQQTESQSGWVDYLRSGGYSDSSAALILNTITKETAYRENGAWRFQKLGGSSGRLPPSADPELAARFSQTFTGDRRPSQALAEIQSDISRKKVLEGADKTAVMMTMGELSWVRFPSRAEAPAAFEDNVRRLTDLSRTVEEFGCTKWCTAHGKAGDFLETGEFFAAVDSEGRARLGIRAEEGQIREIRGVLHSQAMEPSLAPQLTEFLNKHPLSGGTEWVNDAKIKGRVAELAKGGDWADLKKAIGKDDDTEAADFIHSYRGPGGTYDFLIGADNSPAQLLAWEKLSAKPLSQLNMVARAGSFSQARGWIDGSVLDTPRPTEVGGGTAIHPLFADNSAMAGKAPRMLQEWGLLTPDRQSSTDADLNNIWHIQAGGRSHLLNKAVGGPEKADLLPFLEWEGIHRPSLFAANGNRLTPIHLHFEKKPALYSDHSRSEDPDPDAQKKATVEAYRLHGSGKDLLNNDAGNWKYPIIFSVAKGGMLTDVIDAGLVSPEDIATVTDPDGNTAWHKADLADLRRLIAKGHMKPSILGIPGQGGVSVAESICRHPGGFTMLRDTGMINASNVSDFKGTRPSLAHTAACVGEAEKALESGMFPSAVLMQPSLGSGNNFLHLWGKQGLRVSDPVRLRELVASNGIVPTDFEKVNKEEESSLSCFADKPEGLKTLAQAGLVTKEGIDIPGGIWRDTPTNKLPYHSHETYHLLAERGIVTRAHMLTPNKHDKIPLHGYIQDEFNGGDGVEGLKKMATLLGLKSEDLTRKHGEAGTDALEVVRSLRRKLDGPQPDPLLEFHSAGLISTADIFQQRHGKGEPPGLSTRTETQQKLAEMAWGRSPFEDAIRRGDPEVFAELQRSGAVTGEVMSRPHGEKSEWANFTEFVLHQSSEDPAWEPVITSAIEGGSIGRDGLIAPARAKPGPVSLRLSEMATPAPLMSAIRKGAILPPDLTVEGPEPRGSLLSSLCESNGDELATLIRNRYLEPESLSRISIPYKPDSGNPARYLLEKKPELFRLAAQEGLFTREDAVFGRNGFDGPVEHAILSNSLPSLSGPGLLGPSLLNNASRMREAWYLASRHESALGLAQGLEAGGASRAQIKESLTAVTGDGRSSLSSISSKGAATSLSSLAREGFITREEIPGAQMRGLVKNILTDHPADLSALVRSGVMAQGDLYSSRHGRPDMVKLAVSMAKSPQEEIALVRSISDSGVLSPSDAPAFARDLCHRPSGSAALREAVSLGIVGKKALSLPGEDGKSALDILLGRASVTAARREDLSYLMDKGLVPQDYQGRYSRAVEGQSSSVKDAMERVSSRISSLLTTVSAPHPRPFSASPTTSFSRIPGREPSAVK